MAGDRRYEVVYGGSNRRRKKILFVTIATILLFIIITVVVVILFIVPMFKKPSIHVTPTDFEKSEGIHRKVNCGKLSGTMEKASDGTPIYSFKGIPYAYPPVGNLRWKPTAPLPGDGKCWKGVRSATKFGSICAQRSLSGKISGKEDCLFLNVWTPAFNRSGNLPVVVYIHGGSLIIGNGDIPPIREAVRFGIVGVSINYRLNAFGFLTLEVLSEASSSKATSNYGFIDQIEALKWVKANIREFGGDPSRVTIMGYSAGAKSVLALLVSPLANGLFHGAISMSAPPVYNVREAKAAKDNAVFIHRANCDKATENETVECLYGLSTLAVLNAIPWDEYPSWSYTKYSGLPVKGVLSGAIAVVDDIVIPTVPSLLENIKFNVKKEVPVLVGSVAQEMESSSTSGRSISLANLSKIFNSSLSTFSSNLTDEAMKAYGIGARNKSYDLTLVTMETDARMTCQNEIYARNASRSRNHVFYRYIVTNHPSKPVKAGSCCKRYAYHGWDVNALLNFPYGAPEPLSSSDRAFSNRLQFDFLSFIKTGKPARADWLPFTNKAYMEYGTGYSKVVRNSTYHEQHCNVLMSNGLYDYGFML